MLILGKFLEDDEIIQNYKDMSAEAENLRNLNRTMGRKLSHIIKSIIQNSGMIDYNRLSMEERYIYDMIKNSVYQVV